MTVRVSYLQALKNANESAYETWPEPYEDSTYWDRFVQALEQQGWVLRRTVTAQEHEALREVAVRAANGEDVRHLARTALGLSSDPPGPDDYEPPDLCPGCGGSGIRECEGVTYNACPVCDGLGRLT